MNHSAPGSNRLANTTSPYLLQHADNPVHWQPWDEQALALARDQDRPILLSIGYSACHWCHVMAHESFEDADTAAVMNELFVNIKVDREQRPDLDRIYQTAHQLIAGRPGGWPLTVFLAPDQTPFFSGTYFPSQPRHGLSAFRDILRRVAAAYRDQREAIGEQNQALREVLRRLQGEGAGTPQAALLDNARTALAAAFDSRFGGFGAAPKFPQPVALNRLLRTHARSRGAGAPDQQALDMARITLRRMALGGIHDQVGGGFARYSVDNRWMIPHFEKMLYDNAQLLAVYTDAWRATGDALFRRIALETADWLSREMRHPDGGFYASLDADSEGGEGVFYLWTPEQVRELLPPDEAEVTTHRFGLDGPPNFEGRWHLHVQASFGELASRLQRPRDEVVALWQQARGRLLEARNRRPHPHRDDKILTGWNALTALGLARAGRFLDAPALIGQTADCLAFLRRHVWVDGRLRAGWKDGRAEPPGYLEDHAYLLAALLEHLQARWDPQMLDWARALAELLLGRFEDRERGGFHLTADDHEALIQRPRPFGDDSCPAGNGVAALALGRLGHLLAEPRYLAAAERTLHAAGGAMTQLPQGHCSLLDALEEYLFPPTSVLLRPAERLPEWRRQADAGFDPARLVIALPADGEPPALGPIVLDGHGAWVCRGTSCSPRADTPQALADRLALAPS